MPGRVLAMLGVGLLLGAFVLPSGVYAQSAIVGFARDTTEALLPGVMVEVASPVLIEGVRTAVTDERGQYRVVDLRPGVYVVTFTLPGFSTVRRDGIRLEANFTATVNAEMRVGSVEETITVTGEAPMVDVQGNQRSQVLTRELLDALPTARTFSTNTVPAVVRPPDVGGSRTMQHAGMSVYGLSEQSDQQVDGMSIRCSNGGSPCNYVNFGNYEELVYQFGGGNAEATTGGVTVNLISKQGGNEFHGDVFGLFASDKFEATNLTPKQAARGLRVPEALDKQWDVNVSVGGPILSDRLWFFASWRDWAYNRFVADAFDPVTGKQGVYDNHLFGVMGRLTLQVNPANKIAVMYDRLHKNQGHLGIETGGVEPSASRVSSTPIPYFAQAKWTSTPSNALLVEAGYSANMYTRWQKYQPEVRRATCFVAFAACAPGTDYGDIAKVDLIRVTTTGAHPDGEINYYLPIFRFVSSVSYLTGSHAFKTGVQWAQGYTSRFAHGLNAGLVQQYRNGVPDSVVIRNYPNRLRTDEDLNLALYAQDSWTIGRLTLNPGVRGDFTRYSIPEQTAPAGRFVPERTFAKVSNFPKWNDVSPRLGVVYDLSGKGTTAIKASTGKYVDAYAAQNMDPYNPMVLSSDTRTWTDLNRDDIAQENEIGPQTNREFGIRRNVNLDPNAKRPYAWIISVGIQHELWSGAALSVNYNRTSRHQQLWTDNLDTTHADYTLVTIPDPRGIGRTLPVYNLNVAKRGLINEFVTNSDGNGRTYNGVDTSLTVRFGNGGTFTGGTSTGRIRDVICEVDDPNGLRFCDQTQLDIPFRTTFRASGLYPLPYGIRLSGVFQSIAGDELPTTYSVGRQIVRDLTQTSVSVRLDDPGSQYGDRTNQLDIVVSKEIRMGRVQWQPRFEIWNLLNVSPVLTEVTAFGPSLGTPRTTLPARIARATLLVKF